MCSNPSSDPRWALPYKTDNPASDKTPEVNHLPSGPPLKGIRKSYVCSESKCMNTESKISKSSANPEK
jgi:hypothetical protein